MSLFRKVINKLYKSSLQDIIKAMSLRFKPKIKNQEQPRWNKIQSGFGRGLQILVDANSFTGWQSMIDGRYDLFLFEEAAKYCIKDKIIWDIGAHFGYDSLVFSQMAGKQGKVLAFEPNSFNFERLLQNINKNETLNLANIECYSYALSDKSGHSPFRYSDNIEGSQSTGSHLANINPPQNETIYQNFKFKLTEIQTRTVDELVQQYPHYLPFMMKIDVEGAEHLVIKGAKTLLQNSHPILFIEIHSVENMLQICNELSSIGYKLSIIENSEKTQSRCFIKAIYE